MTVNTQWRPLAVLALVMGSLAMSSCGDDDDDDGGGFGDS